MSDNNVNNALEIIEKHFNPGNYSYAKAMWEQIYKTLMSLQTEWQSRGDEIKLLKAEISVLRTTNESLESELSKHLGMIVIMEEEINNLKSLLKSEGGK